ncbi:MAG TPA: DUF3488 domain-containing protein, partial [Candidatus Synoicihabitans sp.]|nr:DUF3488 domain-containing protein [Candidatus Synoicihabitans sp.]
MEPKRPQLSADDLVRLQWLLGSVVAAVSAATILFMEVQAWLLLGAVFTAAIAAVVWPRWPSRVPRWAHALAFPVIAAAFAYDLYASREPLAALIRLDLLLVTYRLMTYRRRRDDLQLIVLGLFLIVVAGVLTVSLAFTVQILAFTACSLVFLFVITLTEVKLTAATTAAPSGAPGAPSWTRGSWSDLARRVRAALDWRVAAL